MRRVHREQLVAALLVVMAAMSLAGCSGEGSDDEGVAVYEPYGEGSDAALLEGQLDIEPNCVYVVHPESNVRHLPVFPADEVERDGSVLTYGEASYEDGDEISLGGGGVGGTWPDADDGYSVPDECDLTVRAFIVGQG